MFVAPSHLAYTDAYWTLFMFWFFFGLFNLSSGLFCRGRPTGPATLAFMLHGRFCAGRRNFSRLKYPPRRWVSGSTCSKCSVRHHYGSPLQRTARQERSESRKMQLDGPVFWIVSMLCFTRVINLKRKVGSGPVWALCGGHWSSHSSPKCHTKTRKAPNFSLTASPGTNYTCETHTCVFFGWEVNSHDKTVLDIFKNSLARVNIVLLLISSVFLQVQHRIEGHVLRQRHKGPNCECSFAFQSLL